MNLSHIKNLSTSLTTQNNTPSVNKRRYYFDNVSPDFMKSDEFISDMNVLIRDLSPGNLDTVYTSVCNTVIRDMNQYVKYKDKHIKASTNDTSNRPKKQFWDSELKSHWESMKEKEKLFRRFRGARNE